MEYSKGEWEVDKWGLVTIINAPTKRIATINMGKSIPESLTNAQLISAAPELYVALKWAMSYVDYCEASETAIEGMACDTFLQEQSRAKKALAKAEGK